MALLKEKESFKMNDIKDIKRWYVFYSQFNHERKIHEILLKSGYNSFLPLIKKLKQWSDRKKWIEEPLFPCYNFIYIPENEIYEVLKKPGIVKSVSFAKERAYLTDEEMNRIEKIIHHQEEVEIKGGESLAKGDNVKIISGNFKGLEGTVVTSPDGKKLVLLLDLLGVSVTVSFDSVTLEKI